MTTAVWAAVVGAQSDQREAPTPAASFLTADHPNQMFTKSQSMPSDAARSGGILLMQLWRKSRSRKPRNGQIPRD